MAHPLAPGAQAHFVDLPGGRFHYLSWAAERTDRPSALLLHGITSSALSWVRVGPALADRYRVYALDMRGHGVSIKPPAGAYSLRHTAADAAAFIEALGLERPMVMGHPGAEQQRCCWQVEQGQADRRLCWLGSFSKTRPMP